MDERHWNYRIIRYADNEGFGLHEVHYVNGEVDSWTERPIVVSQSEAGITEQLLTMRVDAKKRQILDEPDKRSTCRSCGQKIHYNHA